MDLCLRRQRTPRASEASVAVRERMSNVSTVTRRDILFVTALT